MTFVQTLPKEQVYTLHNFVNVIFKNPTGTIFLTSHSEQIKGETPWPYRSLDQIAKSSPNNTFHYCISTFNIDTTGHIRRRVSNFNSLHIIVLDDIGTKVQPPNLQPSYIIETSKDNYQYGYILTTPVQDINIANALIKTICSKEANLTDTGGSALTKMVKLPIGVNLKEGRNNFLIQLKEFNDDLTYDYTYLLEYWNLIDAFKNNITGTLDTSTTNKVEQQLLSDDIIFQWLSDNNIITHDNGNGYFVCSCPRGHEHSDNNPSSGSAYKPLGCGDYPNTRHFKCHHEHAGHSPTTDDFLQWVIDNGGPAAGSIARQPGDTINMMLMADLGIYPHKHESNGKIKVKKTIENLKAMLDWYDISIKRNAYKDAFMATQGTTTYTLPEISSLANMNLLSYTVQDIRDYISVIAAANTHNEVLIWLKQNHANHQHAYDNAIDNVFDTITFSKNTIKNIDMLRKLWRKWLIQCIAATDAAISTPNTQAIAKYESILVLAGGQGAGKSNFLQSLVPKQLQQDYFGGNVLLSIKDKDSIIKVRAYWICELGELDATFRRSDRSELKAYLSSTHDEYRPPYAADALKFPRQTSFCASVNEPKFLHDDTGNRRFWTFDIDNIHTRPTHTMIELMWAEAYAAYTTGESWWIEGEDSLIVAEYTKQYCSAGDDWFIHALYDNFNIDNPSVLNAAIKAYADYGTKLVRPDNPSNFKGYLARDLLRICEIDPHKYRKPIEYTKMLRNTSIPAIDYGSRTYFVLPKQIVQQNKLNKYDENNDEI